MPNDMGKQREEFYKAYPRHEGILELYDAGSLQYLDAFGAVRDFMVWQAAQAAMQPENEQLKQQLSAANQRNKELQSENETCRNLMRIKQEQNDAFNQRIQELEQRLNSFRDIEKRERLLMERVAELEERIRVADAEEPKLLPPVTMEKALTVLMQTDDGDNEAERYLANIDDGCAFVVTKSEMFFHQLRLSVAKNPEIANKVSVLFYQDGEYKKVGLGYEDELRWPVGFLEGAWSMEIEISKVREAIRKNADQPKKN